MSTHTAKIVWHRQSEGFSYDQYNRSHSWQFENGIVIEASAAPEFLGTADRVDPEEAFVASVSSCHMLTFLAICARKRMVVDHYSDRATGFLEPLPSGKLAITRVELSPRIVFEGPVPSPQLLAKLHEQSHHECFIANSIITDVQIV